MNDTELEILVVQFGRQCGPIADQLLRSFTEIGAAVRLATVDPANPTFHLASESRHLVLVIDRWREPYFDAIRAFLHSGRVITVVGPIGLKIAKKLFEAGIADCSLKTDPDDLALVGLRLRQSTRTRVVEADKPEAESDQMIVGPVTIGLRSHSVFVNGIPTEPLTTAEYQILVALASEPDRLFSREEVFRSFNHTLEGVTHRSLDSHLYGLRRKLGEAGRIIETVRGRGYRLATSAISLEKA